MDFDEVVNNRKSVRNFTKKKASWKDVLDAIDAAIQGPFSGSHNHLNFLIVENKDTIEELADCCEQDWILDSGILVVVCSDDNQLENLFEERGRVYSRQQAGAAVQTLLLKLVDLGLAGCWVGAYDDARVRVALSIPKEKQIEAIVVIGHEGVKEKRKPKRKLENVLYWEKWGEEKRPTLFEEDTSDDMD